LLPLALPSWQSLALPHPHRYKSNSVARSVAIVFITDRNITNCSSYATRSKRYEFTSFEAVTSIY